MDDPRLKMYGRPEASGASMVVGWREDAAKIGWRTTRYLTRKLGGQKFAEIEPVGFFPLSGVMIENDVAEFPQSTFYYCPPKNIVVFESNAPSAEWYEFLNLILDVAEQCHVKEVYAVGGMVSLGAHAAPRPLLATANSPEMKTVLSQYDLARDMDFETPPGQRPTVNSYLGWIAGRRNILAASLWVPVPLYLVSTFDPQAVRTIAGFLDTRLGLGIDFRDIEEDAARQNQRIALARSRSPEIDAYIQKLESNSPPSQEENEKLVREIEEFLRESD
ncbi:MAG: PAC2 family protein [Chloroflexi bacterium]|nr:PAC2 family protein [Chloroflexota bacterium]